MCFSSGVIYWSGEDPNGVWRAGEESEPSATSSGATISSYSILDRMLIALNSTSRYPKLRHVAIVGHSSGGQTVQRYSLTQHAQHLGEGIGRSFRYIVANPSSYCYLDARRWIDGHLVIPTEEQLNGCYKYNMWEWGLAGDFPRYFVGDRSVSKMIHDYATQDVVYLLGKNDTCNEDLKPGCQSHGLEKTCMDMFEGLFRLQRGQRYYAFLNKFYDWEIHNMSIVPNVGHDHTLMFQSKKGLEAIFTPGPATRSGTSMLKKTANIALVVLASCVFVALLFGLYRNLQRSRSRTANNIPRTNAYIPVTNCTIAQSPYMENPAYDYNARLI